MYGDITAVGRCFGRVLDLQWVSESRRTWVCERRRSLQQGRGSGCEKEEELGSWICSGFWICSGCEKEEQLGGEKEEQLGGVKEEVYCSYCWCCIVNFSRGAAAAYAMESHSSNEYCSFLFEAP
ncbi:hypothetical protein TEA_001032 [Camellia sinensis var. sinensis]|uniref:Uncharacterized protein n=1 Tax=Camellia sinensis var. sinensis TaxID=542762 RepID=A0A4S4E8F1_CAMSN|nr:hypothetical protein TEA_001032 [Camellia sinensis var. sinensis]